MNLIVVKFKYVEYKLGCLIKNIKYVYVFIKYMYVSKKKYSIKINV